VQHDSLKLTYERPIKYSYMGNNASYKCLGNKINIPAELVRVIYEYYEGFYSTTYRYQLNEYLFSILSDKFDKQTLIDKIKCRNRIYENDTFTLERYIFACEKICPCLFKGCSLCNKKNEMKRVMFSKCRR